MRGRVQCSQCPRLDEQDWCAYHVERVPFPGRWRVCAQYTGLPPLATVRGNLAEAGLLRFVTELADEPGGRRWLRLVGGTPQPLRFKIYAAAGLLRESDAEAERLAEPAGETRAA